MTDAKLDRTHNIAERYVTYGITINPHPQKKICFPFSENNLKYMNHTNEDQKLFITMAIEQFLDSDDLSLHNISCEWELTKKGAIHLHALITGWEKSRVMMLGEHISRIFDFKNGLKNSFHYSVTQVSKTHWEAYMTKQSKRVLNSP